MAELRFSRAAASEISEIYVYTSRRFGVAQAERYAQALRHALSQIAERPDLGRPCDEIRQGYHRVRCERHVIFYRPTMRSAEDDSVWIVRVLHARMDFRRHL